jgi:hypothetical protein
VETFSEGGQVDSRRSFLTALALTGAVGGLWAPLRAEQVPQGPRTVTDPSAVNPNLPSPTKRALEENEKDIKKKVERLYELATELKAEVDKTDSSKVLSLTMMKKAEEIEKLARDIKVRSKG